MKWELGALKILARNETVPGIALRDTIQEIERLRVMVYQLEVQLPKKLARNEDRIEIEMTGKKVFRQKIINLIATALEDVEADPGSGYSLTSSIEPDGCE